MARITLTRLTEDDREQFILDNQWAFKYGAMEEFGERDSHFEEDGEIISRKTIENSIDSGVAYRIREDGISVGGLILTINEETFLCQQMRVPHRRVFQQPSSGSARSPRPAKRTIMMVRILTECFGLKNR